MNLTTLPKVGWHWQLAPSPDAEAVKSLREALKISEPLATLFCQRAATTPDQVRALLVNEVALLHDPLSMKGMREAVSRIMQALTSKQKILVYGDYDVDGTSAVALVTDFLAKHTTQLEYYIPDRYTEGYGISERGVRWAATEGFSLVIALDCGIKEHAKIDLANSFGLDFIVCDHHLPDAHIPKATAVLNPLQPGCHYPYKYLSGCGIGFKLVQALAAALGDDPRDVMQYVDLVAIAAACDIVPMTGENRALTHLGLQLMQHTLKPGLKAMFEQAKLYRENTETKAKQLTRELEVGDLVFALGPRINAAGRMQHGSIAVNLLRAKSDAECREPAAAIAAANDQRKLTDKAMLDEALEQLASQPSHRKTNVIFNPNWHKGVVGIVASRVQEYFYKPTIVLTLSDGKITGSARSVAGFDVHHAIEQCAPLLTSFGGHHAAAGLSLLPSEFNTFKRQFEEVCAATLPFSSELRRLHIDLEIDFDDLTDNFMKSVARLGPFGPQNMRPVFVTHGVVDSGRSTTMGADGDHLRLDVRHQKSLRGPRWNGVAFGMGHYLAEVQSGRPFSMAYTAEWNAFNGVKQLQLMVKDLRRG